jgi:beta-phosphoglucomutase
LQKHRRHVDNKIMPPIDVSTKATPIQNRRCDGVRAFLFDVDGVLADTARLHEAAWRRLAQREGLPFDHRTARDLRGLSREASLRRILGNRAAAPEHFVKMMDRKNADYLALVAQLTPLDVLPGALRLLKELRRLDLNIAAVSISRNARTVLDRLDLTHYFDAVVDGNDAAPSGDGRHRFLLAAAALHVEPGQCVVVEDSAVGVAAARQFGMKSIGVGDADALCAATMTLESLHDVEAEFLIDRLSEPARVASMSHGKDAQSFS